MDQSLLVDEKAVPLTRAAEKWAEATEKEMANTTALPLSFSSWFLVEAPHGFNAFAGWSPKLGIAPSLTGLLTSSSLTFLLS